MKFVFYTLLIKEERTKHFFAQGNLISCGFIINLLQEPAAFSPLGQAVQHVSLVQREFSHWQSVLMCKLITDQIFVKGDWMRRFPFDGKGELSALNVEPRNGKWVSYLFQIVDLSWVKWKAFMLGGCKRPKREKSVGPKFHSQLFNYFSFPLYFFFRLESQWAATISFAFEAISVA